MPIAVNAPSAMGLSLVRTKPDGYSLCRHCNRLREQDGYERQSSREQVY